jgi:phosphatidylserine/phosphatidylglycerophosphate/cardiolipin synthase-like enzyme
MAGPLRMAGQAPVGVLATRVAGVPDDQYHPAVRHVVEASRSCLYASVFIVDTNAHDDPDARILELLRLLKETAWRGVDVRLLIGSSQRNIAIGEACHVAWALATELGVSCRIIASGGNPGSHLKVVLNEGAVLTGSHNWSLGAMTGKQVQDSVLVHSPALSSYLRESFLVQWRLAESGS